MGTSTDAMLLYGYHLGGDDSGWEIEEVDEYGDIDYSRIGWLAEDSEDDDDFDFSEAAEVRLLASVGFTETDWDTKGFYERRKEAKALLGVMLETHCSGESPMHVLCAARHLAHRGHALPLDPDELAARVAREDLDAKLARAVAALGMTPKQARPAWLLCSYWG